MRDETEIILLSLPIFPG